MFLKLPKYNSDLCLYVFYLFRARASIPPGHVYVFFCFAVRGFVGFWVCYEIVYEKTHVLKLIPNSIKKIRISIKFMQQ